MFIDRIKNKLTYKLYESFAYIFWKTINCIDRKRLHNSDFTILCSTCIGGVIYHKLQQPFLTPTINLWMTDIDLIKFALNIDEYREQKKIEFIKSEYDYPVARIKDITIYFNHCKTENEAEKQWFKRVNRINKDNLFVIAADRCSFLDEEIKLFRKISCRGKILFTSNKNLQEDFALFLPYYEDQEKTGIYMLDRGDNYYKVAPYDGYFDYVYFFNTGLIKRTYNIKDKLLMRLGKKENSYKYNNEGKK